MADQRGDKVRQEPTHPKVREGDFRIWDVSRGEVVAGVKKFLQYTGYELQPEEAIGSQRPDFRAKRKTAKGEFEVVGIVGQGLEEAVSCCAQLQAFKAILGNGPDYVLCLPPVNEYLLIEFFMEDKGRHFFAMKEQEFMLWLHNPAENVTWCILGSPRDRHFNSYFVLTTMSIDQYINMKLSRELLEEEEQ